MMARKRQASGTAEGGKRRKRSGLYVNDAEYARIEARAAAAGMSLSTFVSRRALEDTMVNRADWRRCVQQQATILKRLERIAEAAEDRASVLDAGRILLALRAIEQQADALMPGAPEAEGGEDDASEDALVSDTDAEPPC